MSMRPARLLLAAGLLAAMSTGSLACKSVGGAKFPLRVESGKHYPTDREGHPFFLHGDTAWSLIADLKEEEAHLYLEDRKARGFNTVLVSLLEHRFSRNAPANAYGDKPFADNGDFVVPNEAYFVHADRILHKACELGLLVLLTPAYLGYGGGDEGWYREMAAAGPETLGAYGRFVGLRYRHLDNIMWVNGGDYDPADKDLVSAVANGIMEEDPNALATVHGAPETATLEFWGYEPWLQVNNVYTYGPVHAAAIREHKIGRGMPFFLMESAYEFEHGADEHRIRIQAYHAILSGAFGHLYGNNPMWHFGGPGVHQQTMEWKEALDSPGARSMEVLLDFVSSVKWWLLEPDSKNKLLIDGIGADMGRAVAATAKDGSYAVIYMPGNKWVTVDLAQLSASSVQARWRDPTSGEVTVVDGSPFAAQVQSFKPPRNNGRGTRTGYWN
ncbi:DUF4038 domain-containing protein (plasmid) [Mesorhizobium sp. AaZ16]|uniref:apiosidase-like domain-containing protein n=1 Tax=Mesorhizobium sp. AaZ16 TaxID=3402289 RepID=UPI00374FC430